MPDKNRFPKPVQVTFRDLARESGISVATISRYFSQKGPVSAPVAQRIARWAAKLGYQRRPVGRQKALHRKALGLLVAKTMRPQVVADVVLEEIRDRLGLAAHRAGFELVFLESHVGDGSFYKRRILFEELRGVFLYGDWDLGGIPEYCHNRLLPLVHLNRKAKTGHCVTIDQEMGAFLATQHLLITKRKPTGICIPTEGEISQLRLGGWRRAHLEKGLKPGPILPIPTAGIRQGYQAMTTYLRRVPPVAAMFVNNDATALGVMRALHEARVSVPDEMALVGFDDLEIAAHTIPTLSTVKQDFQELCQVAMGLMTKSLSKKPLNPQTIQMSPRLIVRESSCSS